MEGEIQEGKNSLLPAFWGDSSFLLGGSFFWPLKLPRGDGQHTTPALSR